MYQQVLFASIYYIAQSEKGLNFYKLISAPPSGIKYKKQFAKIL
jgi:hypothetical protein